MFSRHDRKQQEEGTGHCGPWKHFRGKGGFWGEMGAGWGRHGRHGMGGRFGGDFGGRLFDSGDLRLVILSYIAEKPSHGYEIMKGIGEQMGGVYTPSAGVVYPTLNLLEDEGFATVSHEGGKKQYTITEAGQAELAANKSRIDELLGRIQQAGEAFGGGRTLQIMRAMHNCKIALKMKFGQGDLTDDQVRKIVGIIDTAAREIERA
jgi:DNA-binding PadR family transcriptional regulator